jgi:hypothetical protein
VSVSVFEVSIHRFHCDAATPVGGDSFRGGQPGPHHLDGIGFVGFLTITGGGVRSFV